MPQVSVITGGAGGMGLATAKKLGRDHSIVISAVNLGRLDDAAAELRTLGIAATAVPCDITDRDSVEDLVRNACALGTVTSVVHAAGVSPSMGTAELIIKINAVGTVNVNEAFLDVAGEDFAMVNVASMAAHFLPSALLPTRLFGLAIRDLDAFATKMTNVCRIAPKGLQTGCAYSLSKSFVRWYCRSQASRFGRRGARIVSVSPGSIDTEMGRLEEVSGSAAMIRHAALNRFGTADEVAELLAFCASAKPGYLTGTDILCDGGVVASMTLRDKLVVARGR